MGDHSICKQQTCKRTITLKYKLQVYQSWQIGDCFGCSGNTPLMHIWNWHISLLLRWHWPWWWLAFTLACQQFSSFLKLMALFIYRFLFQSSADRSQFSSACTDGLRTLLKSADNELTGLSLELVLLSTYCFAHVSFPRTFPFCVDYFRQQVEKRSNSISYHIINFRLLVSSFGNNYNSLRR